MNLREYLAKSMETEPGPAKYIEASLRFRSLVEISHHAIGFSTEVGEWIESRCKPEFERHTHEEIGDMWWYIAGLIRWCFYGGELDGDGSHPFAIIHNRTGEEPDEPEPDELVIVASQILDQVKRGLFYGKIDMDKMRDYTRIAAQLLADLGEAHECWDANIRKLNEKRYPNGFSEEAALKRDIEGERDALSGGVPPI